ncbi:AAA family ATPase [Gloeothece verrucosa]|uniref:AAA family ATPase n=1 Tax=Gloeothece verrucosa TaxID=2546359 RepID=UPI00030B3ADD|nr:AAA family ATPase [Gloeothece verrucosa]
MSDTILKRIKIEGFKSIRSLDLTLNQLNILIGANGSGKSNFIAAFKFLNQIVNQNLQYFVAKSGGVDRFLHFGQKNRLSRTCGDKKNL